jgi:hypothetical protein
MSLKSRRPEQAGIRLALLMTVLFLAGMAVGAWWVYRSTNTPGAPPSEVAGQTLAASTRSVLKSLNSAVEIQFYSLLTEGGSSAELREFAKRVNQLLADFDRESGGKIRVSPNVTWSDATTRNATAAGVVPFNVGGDPAYLGLVVLQDGRKETLAQLRPEWEPALEFDLARAIARVVASPSRPVSTAETALARSAAEAVERSIPNLTAVSLEEGKRILREAALKEYKAAVAEMDVEIKEAERRLLEAQAANSGPDRQTALEQLRQVQSKHTQKLNDIATHSQAQIEAFQRMKNQ